LSNIALATAVSVQPELSQNTLQDVRMSKEPAEIDQYGLNGGAKLRTWAVVIFGIILLHVIL